MITILPLGCYGSDLEEKKCISMRLTESTIIDAGAILSTLSKTELLKIKNIIITHSHYDHIKDLPTLADFMLSYGMHTFDIYTTEAIASQVHQNIFNDLIWPDFTKLPSKGTPTITFKYFEYDKPFSLDGHEIVPIKVNHVVESVGFLIRKGSASVGYSGDTYYCDNFIDYINAEKNLKALCYETSFPNKLATIAKNSKHLTPNDLSHELAKIKQNVPVHIFHLKPSMLEEIEKELLEIETDKKLYFMKQKNPIIIDPEI